MVIPLRKITDICRLCLTEELDILIPAKDALDTSLTSEDMERFTGIQIPTDDDVPYVICTDCVHCLRESVNFLKSCVQNDQIYQQIFSEFIDEIRAQSDGCMIQETDTTVNDIVDFDLDNKYFTHFVQLQELPAPNEEQSVQSPKKESERFQAEAASSKSENSSTRSTTTTNCHTVNNDAILPITQAYHKPRKQNASSHPIQLCDICGQTTTCYKKHLVTHTKAKDYACPHCPLRLTDNSNLTRHIEAVHLKLIIRKCEICDKGFTHHHSYNSHMRGVHNIGEKYKCKFCPKEFNSNRSIHVHVNKEHIIGKKFECNLCSKPFQTSSALRKHKSVHSDEQPYTCSDCPKRFKSSFGRNVHQLTHKGIIFSCQHCEKSYRYKAQLALHMAKQHSKLVSDEVNASGAPEKVNLKIKKNMNCQLGFE